jgi:hypothetical protein
MKKSSGFIFYEGPSMIDGAPIVAIATRNTKNRKTGDLWQTWIIRADMSPMQAVNSGADESVCGGCRHRGRLETQADGTLKNKSRKCYVKVWQAPTAVYKAFKKGSYARYSRDAVILAFDGQAVRMGSYGDPMAIPLEVWESILRYAEFWTGYTHQWKGAQNGWQKFVMASADTVDEYWQAKTLGFRVFRVRGKSDGLLAKRETICPASKEAGKKTVCALCKACGGTSSKAKVDIAIRMH